MLTGAQAIVMLGTARGEAGKAFYADTLGLKFIKDDGFAFHFDLGGRLLRLSRVPAVVPAAYAVLGFEVKGIEKIVDALIAKGVQMERYGFLQQDARGVWTAPDGAKVAWFRDPDLNLLSVVETP
jgi:catechol 2,3-dioxygenase-like lactoylglutathione lyase family enzyme